jgi:hypothetical protein
LRAAALTAITLSLWAVSAASAQEALTVPSDVDAAGTALALLMTGEDSPPLGDTLETRPPRASAASRFRAGIEGLKLPVPEELSEPDGPSDAQEETGPRVDAWGASPNAALGIGEILIVNAIPWAFNEYVRNANFSQVNPRSWYENVQHGFTWDDNNFSTNMFAHPFHGNLYYNAGRSNGFSYWQSVPFAFGGSLIWEFMGETHPPAINDWIHTSLGGIAIGETLSRISSTVLDNQATGSERVWREIGAAALNPVRGFNRLVTGRIGKVYENPENPWDHIPPKLSNLLMTGVRVVQDRGRTRTDEEGNVVNEGAQVGAYFEVDFQFGGPFQLDRRKPFDFFTMGLQINTQDKKPIGRWQIRGSLTHWDLKREENVRHRIYLAQNYDYYNNNAFEWGGQSVGGVLISGWDLSERWELVTTAEARAVILGADNFDGANLQDFPTQERLREYDFGPGVEAGLAVRLVRNELRLIDFSYRPAWLWTVNGAVVRSEAGDVEDSARHFIQVLHARVRVPIHRNFHLGAEWRGFFRDTTFDDADFAEDLHQFTRELLVFGAWSVGRGSSER